VVAVSLVSAFGRRKYAIRLRIFCVKHGPEAYPRGAPNSCSIEMLNSSLARKY
jgi:hypothetical protein